MIDKLTVNHKVFHLFTDLIKYKGSLKFYIQRALKENDLIKVLEL